MPLYEYECNECGRRTEKIQKFSDPELTVCPHCGGVLERTVTAPAIQFKGGGWYKDLYSSAKPVASDTGKGSEASGSGGGDSAKSKPAESSAPAASSSGSSGASAAPAPSAAPAASGSPGPSKS